MIELGYLTWVYFIDRSTIQLYNIGNELRYTNRDIEHSELIHSFRCLNSKASVVLWAYPKKSITNFQAMVIILYKDTFKYVKGY